MTSSDLRFVSGSLDAIYGAIREQVGKRVQSSLKLLAQSFKLFSPSTGAVTFDEFEQVLSKAGIFLKRQELTKLYRDLDTENNETASYFKFLDRLQPETSARRQRIIQLAYDSIQKSIGSDAAVPTVRQVAERFDAFSHPAVVLGWSTPELALERFVRTIDEENRGSVSWDDFAKYYISISAGYSDDDLFVAHMEGVWHVKEVPTDDQLSAKDESRRAASMQRAHQLMAMRILQKDWKGKWQWQTLAAHFKFHDADEVGHVSQEAFGKALSRAGLLMGPQTQANLFQIFDIGGGRFDYNSFARELYRLLDSASAQ